MSKIYQNVYIYRFCIRFVVLNRPYSTNTQPIWKLLNTTTLIRNLIYIRFWYNFDTVLYQFLETGTSDRCLICIVQRLRFSGFKLYPLSLFLYRDSIKVISVFFTVCEILYKLTSDHDWLKHVARISNNSCMYTVPHR